MSSLFLPRLLTDGAVLQRRKSIHIWGWDEAGSQIEVSFDGVTASASCDEKGRFDVYLPARESGGPYTLIVSDDKGERVTVNDILVGIVWLCTGQSNMELPMNRVKDEYPEVINGAANDRIRTFKITEETSYHGPLEEHHTGSWVSVKRDTIEDFSATAYFFAGKLQEITGQPVGLINATLGGSRISSWMSREMLEGYDDLLAEIDKYADDDFIKSQIDKNLENGDTWRNSLYEKDLGIKEEWYKKDIDTSDWKKFTVPNFFKDTELKGFIGSVWFRKKFDLPKELAGKKARLFMGTMVDSDTMYVNGIKVGETPYQYPPRKYDIPESLTTEKDNTLTIRLCVETGNGRFTPDKEYKLFNDAASVFLDGEWEYKVGATCKMIEPTDFVNWKSTGLYNAMTAPCRNFPIDGVIWYQGESNIEDRYSGLQERMVEGYRKEWNDENLPFIGTQLPKFVIDQLPSTDDWGKFRITQSKILKMPMTGLAVTLDAGEDNDLHPVKKKPVGERLALWAAHLKYGYAGEYTGPIAEGLEVNEDKDEFECTLKLSHDKGLAILDAGKGTELLDFFVVDKSGNKHHAKAKIEDDKVRVSCSVKKEEAARLQWCLENTHRGGLIVNGIKIPMMPFELK